MISLYRREVLVHHGANQPIYGEVAFHKPLVKIAMPKLRRVVFGFHNLRACSHSNRVSNVLLHNTFILMVYSRIERQFLPYAFPKIDRVFMAAFV